jgi:hypothetical protein
MLFKIAERVGKTVRELTHGEYPLSAYEFAEWVAVFELENNAKDNNSE